MAKQQQCKNGMYLAPNRKGRALQQGETFRSRGMNSRYADNLGLIEKLIVIAKPAFTPAQLMKRTVMKQPITTNVVVAGHFPQEDFTKIITASCIKVVQKENAKCIDQRQLTCIKLNQNWFMRSKSAWKQSNHFSLWKTLKSYIDEGFVLYLTTNSIWHNAVMNWEYQSKPNLREWSGVVQSNHLLPVT